VVTAMVTLLPTRRPRANQSSKRPRHGSEEAHAMAAATTSAQIEGHNRQAALDQLHTDVYGANMAPFWAIDRSVANDEDGQVMAKAKAMAFVWRYKDQIEPLLYRSAELISTESSERRSLILVNPGLAPRRASVTTMYTAYRLNDPNEIMPPHRHSPNAIRLRLTGRQNFTDL